MPNDNDPLLPRQFLFEHHTPTPGTRGTVIPDHVVRRIVGNMVRGVNERGCWRYCGSETLPKIGFKDLHGLKYYVAGNRLAVMLADDAPIPPGRTANHTCHNPWCVYPLHIYRGTSTENMLDAYLDGRRAVPARTDACREEYARLLRDRAAREGRVIQCRRFFAEDVLEEIDRAQIVQPVRASAAA